MHVITLASNYPVQHTPSRVNHSWRDPIRSWRSCRWSRTETECERVTTVIPTLFTLSCASKEVTNTTDSPYKIHVTAFVLDRTSSIPEHDNPPAGVVMSIKPKFHMLFSFLSSLIVWPDWSYSDLAQWLPAIVSRWGSAIGGPRVLLDCLCYMPAGGTQVLLWRLLCLLSTMQELLSKASLGWTAALVTGMSVFNFSNDFQPTGVERLVLQTNVYQIIWITSPAGPLLHPCI